MKKVLVIGAKGMLGGEIARQFSQDKNYEVLGWDFGEIDITDAESADEKIRQAQPDILINCAAYNNVDEAETEEGFKKALALNTDAPKKLAEIVKEIDAVFVQYVTDYVFDGEKGEYIENDEKSPISKYGESKAKGEDNVKQVGGKYYLIRISKLFGLPGKSENAKKSFFETMLTLAKEKNELKVINSEKSCFTYVFDLANATKKLIEEKYSFGIYHIVNEGAVTWYEGVLKLFEIVGIKNVNVLPVTSDEFPRPAKRAKSTVLINTKFPKLPHYEDAIKDWLDKRDKVR